MTIFAIDPNDSGAIQLDPTVVDTARFEVGETTRAMRPFVATAPISPLPRYQTDGCPAAGAPTWVFLPDQAGPFRPGSPGTPPPEPFPVPPPDPSPAPPKPSWDAPPAELPVLRSAAPDGPVEQLRPGRYVGRRRRDLPLPALLLSCYGVSLTGGVTVLGIAWAVTR